MKSTQLAEYKKNHHLWLETDLFKNNLCHEIHTKCGNRSLTVYMKLVDACVLKLKRRLPVHNHHFTVDISAIGSATEYSADVVIECLDKLRLTGFIAFPKCDTNLIVVITHLKKMMRPEALNRARRSNV